MKSSRAAIAVLLFGFACSPGQGSNREQSGGSEAAGGGSSGNATEGGTNGQGGGSGGQRTTGGTSGEMGTTGTGGIAATGGTGRAGGTGGVVQTGGGGGTIVNPVGCPVAIPASGLKLRLVASEMTTVEGQSLTAWVDPTSKISATQQVANRRPTVRLNALNGKTVVRFDGEDDFLSFTFPVTGKDKLSVVTVARTWRYDRGGENNDCDFDKDGITDIGRELNCSGTDQTFLAWNEGSGAFKSSGIFLGLGQTESTFRFGTGRAYRFYKTPFVLEKPVNDSFVWTAAVMDGVARTFYINNAVPRGRTNYRDTELFELRTRADQNEAGATQSNWTGAVGDTESTAWLGRGRFDQSTSFWPGEMAELLVYESALSTEDRAQLSRYVKCAYGL
jgi:hypothetical protein